MGTRRLVTCDQSPFVPQSPLVVVLIVLSFFEANSVQSPKKTLFRRPEVSIRQQSRMSGGAQCQLITIHNPSSGLVLAPFTCALFLAVELSLVPEMFLP